jgi:hypothetical protein
MYVRKHGATAGEVSGRERRCSSTAEGEPAARAGKRLGAGRLGACGRGGKRQAAGHDVQAFVLRVLFCGSIRRRKV